MADEGERDSTAGTSQAPVRPVLIVSAGASHSVALLSGNVICSWGRGEDGQLGHGDAADRFSPTQMSALDGHEIVSVTCGADHTTAYSRSCMQVYSWGWIWRNRCFMCKTNMETVDHLLLHCSIVSSLWNWLFELVGIQWVMSKTVMDLLQCWKRKWRNPQAQLMWQLIPMGLMWQMWGERNRRCFEDKESNEEELKNLVYQNLRIWVEVLK